MKNKICCVLNYAPHYRQAIYGLMDNELNCDFYFGSKLQSNIKKIDYSELSNAHELRSVWFFKKVYWMCNSISLIFKPYKKYLITGQMNCLSNWFFILFARILGKEVYIWNHGWYGKENRFQKFLKKIYYLPVNGFFLYGNYARNLMIEQGFKAEKLHVVYNSLNYQQTLELRPNLNQTEVYINYFGNSNPVIIFIGRLQSVKKLDMLLTVLVEQKSKGIIRNLVLIGEGSDKDRLSNIINERGIGDQVWFYGACYDEQMLSQLIYNADICVSPGNVGLTAIHALSYATPIISHDDFANQMPEFEAIDRGVTGNFFKAKSTSSLINTIENWLTLFPHKNHHLMNSCYHVIDSKYNPFFQVEVMRKVLS